MKSPIVRTLLAAACLLAGAESKAQLVVSNPLEWLALAEGSEAVSAQIDGQISAQTRTAALQNAMAMQFAKIREWEGKYTSYLQAVDGYASSLHASATLYEDGVKIFITLGKLQNAVKANPQGVFATMSMNNLYIETATELISVYTLLKEAVAMGGRANMLTGAERSEILWALSDRLGAFSKKLHRLYLSMRYYAMADVWNSITAGMMERDNGAIAREAHRRWKRAAKSVE